MLAANGARSIENAAGASPTSSAIACSSCAPLDADVDELRLRALPLHFGLHHVDPGHHASRVAVARQLERALIGSHCVLEHLPRGVGDAQSEIVLRKRSVGRKARRFELAALACQLASRLHERRTRPHTSSSQLVLSATL